MANSPAIPCKRYLAREEILSEYLLDLLVVTEITVEGSVGEVKLEHDPIAP